ncbi:hypothetical protein FZC66_06670 [Priestia megaterium]|nr:hypothetical protein FZC66_06670 [Priestia megaterium]
MMTNKHIISTISYTRITRKIKFHQQHYIKTEHDLHLFQDRIQTANKAFVLDHVLDISYKPFSLKSGLLYLHTNQGVFTYEVMTDPYSFIEEYKKLKCSF